MSHQDLEVSGDNIQTRMKDLDFVVADPHVVYLDAVMHSPWNHEGGGGLPDTDDWSTYRYTVKDIILGIATHRYNKNTRRLEVRSYFVGEHPIFRELEPTRAMLIVLCCQSYQIGGSLEIYFERGIPFDVRELTERHLGIEISGHEMLLGEHVVKPLFASLSSIDASVRDQILAQGIALEVVCYNIFRDIWATNHIKSLLQRGIPLSWLFQRRPDPIVSPVAYAHLVDHLRAVFLEEYAIRRLEDRQMGETLGKVINRNDDLSRTVYRSDSRLRLPDADGLIDLKPGMPFCFFPVLHRSANMINRTLRESLVSARVAAGPNTTPVLVLPLDFVYLPDHTQSEYINTANEAGAQVMTVGLSMAQLLTEAEISLSKTAFEIDADELDAHNVDRYPD